MRVKKSKRVTEVEMIKGATGVFRKKVIFLPLLLLSVLIFYTVSCTNENGVLSGRITDSSNGLPLDGAFVTTEPLNLSATSDQEGNFVIVDIPSGSYTITVSATDYISVSENIDILAGEEKYISVEMNMSEAEGTPAYMQDSWIRLGGPIGGIGYDIRYKYDDYNTWYVTDANAGLHKSTDNGNTWVKSINGMVRDSVDSSVPVFCVTVDHINPDIVWTGTRYSGIIYKSIDGGNNWEAKINGIDQDLINKVALSFRGFTVHPYDSDTVYAMAEISSQGWSDDGQLVWGMETDRVQGIVYRTTDGGENWTELWRGDNLARYCWIDPNDTNILYVSTGIFDREAANSDGMAGIPGGVGIVKSTDGGATWKIIGEENGLADLYVGSLYMHPENPDILLAGCGSELSGVTGEDTGGVFLSTNGGESWEKLLGDDMFTSVEISEADPNVYYAASGSAVYRSDDAGEIWNTYTRESGTWGPPGVIGGTPIDMQCDPRDPNRVFINSYLGGVFLSSDGGQTWSNVSSGYTGAEVKVLALVGDNPKRLYTGSRTGVFSTIDGGKTWIGHANPSESLKERPLNEIIAIAVDPKDPDHVLTSGVDINGIVSSFDGGSSWEVFPVPVTIVPFEFVFAPSNPSTVYANVTKLRCWVEDFGIEFDYEFCDQPGIGLYVSNDRGETWGQAMDSETGFNLITFAVDPEDVQTVYASRLPYELYKSIDSGASWQQIGTGLPEVPIRSLAIDPADRTVLYAGTYKSGIYRSTDSGQSWSHTSSGLNPEANITSIIVDRANPGVVYASGRLSGVYVSTDSGLTWQDISTGLDTKEILQLALSTDGTVLYAGTSGDGAYRLGGF